MQPNGHTNGEEFISKTEVARRLKKRTRTIENWMKQGLLPYYKINHSVAFKWSEIEAHLGKTCRVCRGAAPERIGKRGQRARCAS